MAYLEAARQKSRSKVRFAPAWLGWLDSNQRTARVKVWCLTAWLHPIKTYWIILSGAASVKAAPVLFSAPREAELRRRPPA